MATIFIDGFDKYGIPGSPAANLVPEWTSQGGFVAFATGLSATGYSVIFTPNNGGTSLNKTLSTNYTRLIGGMRFNTNLASTFGVVFGDAASNQSSIAIEQSTGTISAHTGYFNGTTLASGTAVAASTTHYLEWDFTFGASSPYKVYLDGTIIINGTGATKTTGNSYANTVSVQVVPFGAMTWQIDDWYLFDSSGSTNNAPLLTNPRIETRSPTADTQTQFTNVATILGTNYSVTANTNAPGANQIFLRKYTAQVGQNLAGVSCVPQATSAGAKFKAVVYPDSGGSPNGRSLLATGVEITGTTSGTVLTSTFLSPPALTALTTYWIGFITDTSVLLQETDTTTTGVKASNTYASGAPATCPTVTTGQNSWNIYGNCTGATTNWSAVDQNPAAGDPSCITATVGVEDLYSFPALQTTSSVVYTLAARAHARKTDTGVRTLDLRVKSGSTDSAGSAAGQTVQTSYAWVSSYFDLDPNGNIAWTGTAANAATSGPKVVS